jgi:hypothetical protein
MAEKKYPVHAEYSEKYPAIDGIAKPERPTGNYVRPAEKAIRSDIEKILEMDDANFKLWFIQREEATHNLLHQYQLFVSIPDIRYGSEKQKLGMDANTVISTTIGTLKEGIEYLGIISKIREEYIKLNSK